MFRSTNSPLRKADHATVPLYYENRIPQLLIENPTLAIDLMAIVRS